MHAISPGKIISRKLRVPRPSCHLPTLLSRQSTGTLWTTLHCAVPNLKLFASICTYIEWREKVHEARDTERH